jgi:hypothetical protein
LWTFDLSRFPVSYGVNDSTVRADAYHTVGILLSILPAPMPTVPEAPHKGVRPEEHAPSLSRGCVLENRRTERD